MPDPVPELADKIRYLLDTPRARAIARRISGIEVTSLPTLARACGVKSHTNFTPDENRLSDGMAAKLQRVYAIDVASEQGGECWSEFLVGSRHDFVDEFETLHPAEQRFIAVPIDERTQSIDDPEQRVWVRVSLRSQDTENRTFDGELVCQVFTRIGVRLAVRRGTLKVISRNGRVPPMSARLAGSDGMLRIERKANTIEITAGGRDHMNWAIEASSPPLGVVSAPLEGLFRCDGLQVGDEFDVTFEVEDGDLEADQPAQSGAAIEALAHNGDDAIVGANGTPLGASKRQLLAHIAKHSMGLFGPQRIHWAILCSYAFKIAVAEKTDDLARS